MNRGRPYVEWNPLKVFVQATDKALKRLAVRIRIDEDEPLPDTGFDFRQTHACRVDQTLKVPGGWYRMKFAFGSPGEAVVRTTDSANPPVAASQSSPSMQATVRVGLDRSVVDADDDVLPAVDLVEDGILRFRKMFNPADHL